MESVNVAWIVVPAVVLITVLFLVLSRRRSTEVVTSRPVTPLPQQASAPQQPPPGWNGSLTAADAAELRYLAGAKGKIHAIKRAREMQRLGLAEAKELVERLVHDPNYLPTPAAGAPATDVASVGAPSSPLHGANLADAARRVRDQDGLILAIKYVREQTGMGLAESKKFVESLH